MNYYLYNQVSGRDLFLSGTKIQNQMEQTIIMVTVINDGKMSKKSFLTKEAAEKWIDYKKNVENSTAEYTVKEQPAGLFGTIYTLECEWFPTGRETKDRIELAQGLKLGLCPGTWIPNPNPTPDTCCWRLKKWKQEKEQEEK